MNSIDTRRSIRKYAHRDVSDELLQSMLAHAEHTQTMGNLQLYSVVATRDAELKKRLAPAHFNQPMVTEAPVVLTFCADFRRTTVWAENRKATPGYDNFLSFINAATDALLFCQTFCNIADEQGLGYCFLGTTIYDPQTIIDVLKLPKLVMGWPDEDPAVSDRLPLKAILHKETFHDYTPEDIDEYYKEKEALPENRHFVEINNKETLAQVFTDCRYTKRDNEAMSAGMIEVLKRQGFLK